MRTHTRRPQPADRSYSNTTHPRWRAAVLLTGFALLAATFTQPLKATVITVTGFDSTVADDGVCTLREAIASANARLSSGSTPGECPAGSSGSNRIRLTGQVILDATDVNYTGNTGLPIVTSHIILEGNHKSIERGGGAPRFRIFAVSPSGYLELFHTWIENGKVRGTSFGGGILNHGHLVVDHTLVMNNTADGGAGGIWNSGTLEVIHSTIAENEVHNGSELSGNGGGIANVGTLKILDSSVLNNEALGGGGINQVGGTAMVTRSAIFGNIVTSDAGGGVRLSAGTLTMTNSSLSDNTAPYGGGIKVGDGRTATLVHTTIFGNTATSAGGGVYVETGSTLNLTNSIIAGSTGSNCFGTVTVSGTNLTDNDTSCAGITANSLTDFDTTLQGNGGATATHAIGSTSSARDAAGSCGTEYELLLDQRNAIRDATCDVGAYEYNADDRYEQSGTLLSDDNCIGHHIPLGSTEHHLFTADPDWITFHPQDGATYQIETWGLVGGADTQLFLYRGCSTELTSDDDGGEDVASLIEFQATAADSVGWNVQVVDFFGTYGNNRGYDITVSCIAGCPAGCDARNGSHAALQAETVLGNRRYEVCDDADAFASTVETGGELLLRVGNAISLGDDFVVKDGGTLVLGTDPDL